MYKVERKGSTLINKTPPLPTTFVRRCDGSVYNRITGGILIEGFILFFFYIDEDELSRYFLLNFKILYIF